MITQTPVRNYGWEWAVFDNHSQNQLTFKQSQESLTNLIPAFSEEPFSLGVFFNKDFSIFLPALKITPLTDHFLIATSGILPVKKAPLCLLMEIYHFLSRLLPHDLNGKLMGINGIYSSWQQFFPDADAATEDLGIIKESFEGLSHETTLLSWLAKSGESFERAISQEEVKQTLESSLRRHYQPPNSFTFKLNSEGQSFYATPYFLAFWISSTCKILAHIKEPKDKIEFMLESCITDNQNSIRIHIHSDSIYNWLSNIDTYNLSQVNPSFFLWLSYFIASKGSIKLKEPSNIVMSIPNLGSSPSPNPLSIYFQDSQSSAPNQLSFSTNITSCDLLKEIYPRLPFIDTLVLPKDIDPAHNSVIQLATDSLNRDLGVLIYHEK